MIRKEKKGLTPIIAVILLLMMTVAAAGAAFFWFIRVQGELQGGGEQFSQELNQKLTSTLEFTLGEYENSTRTLTLIFKNTGAAPVPVQNSSVAPTTTWILQDKEQKILCNADWAGSPSQCKSGCGTDIPVSALHTVELELVNNTDCDIGTDVNETLYFFKVDFSGVTAVGGSFTK